MKIRTIRGTLEELRKEDPDCAITESCIRKLCKDGTIPYQKSGSKYLINFEDVRKLFVK